jgi:DNA-binding protein HU-beta
MTKTDISVALGAILETITEALMEGDKVSLIGFGSLEVRERSKRQGRNPSTGEPITIPASKVVFFSAGSRLKELVQ